MHCMFHLLFHVWPFMVAIYSTRPRSTSDSKSKKPSVITAFKNNFFNRGHNNNNGNSSSSSSSSSSNSCSNVNGCNNNNNPHHAKSCGCVNGIVGAAQGAQNMPAPPNCSCLGAEPQGNGCLSAPPLSPSNGAPGSVIDPFSLDFLYARSNSVCSDCSQPVNSHYQSHAPQRPRSRSGSSGPTSTMARVLDIFRGRSNSIATTNAVAITAETCCSRPVSREFFSKHLPVFHDDTRQIEEIILRIVGILRSINVITHFLVTKLLHHVITHDKHLFFNNVDQLLYLDTFFQRLFVSFCFYF